MSPIRSSDPQIQSQEVQLAVLAEKVRVLEKANEELKAQLKASNEEQKTGLANCEVQLVQFSTSMVKLTSAVQTSVEDRRSKAAILVSVVAFLGTVVVALIQVFGGGK